jgi:hypothetical protein
VFSKILLLPCLLAEVYLIYNAFHNSKQVPCTIKTHNFNATNNDAFVCCSNKFCYSESKLSSYTWHIKTSDFSQKECKFYSNIREVFIFTLSPSPKVHKNKKQKLHYNTSLNVNTAPYLVRAIWAPNSVYTVRVSVIPMTSFHMFVVVGPICKFSTTLGTAIRTFTSVLPAVNLIQKVITKHSVVVHYYVQILFISDRQYVQLFFLFCTSTLDVYTHCISTYFELIDSTSGTA